MLTTAKNTKRKWFASYYWLTVSLLCIIFIGWISSFLYVLSNEYKSIQRNTQKNKITLRATYLFSKVLMEFIWNYSDNLSYVILTTWVIIKEKIAFSISSVNANANLQPTGRSNSPFVRWLVHAESIDKAK